MGEFTTGTIGEKEAFQNNNVLRGRIVKIVIICILLSHLNVWQSASFTRKLGGAFGDLSTSSSSWSDRNNTVATMPLLENNRASSPPSLSVHRINDSIVEEPTTTPDWLLEYTVWHSQVRQTLNETNWKNYQYLVLKCPRGHICGGASDRLKSVPLLVYLASLAKPKRLFFIHWTKPAPLEEFLVPPSPANNTFVLDWRLPPWLAPELKAGKPNAWYRLKGDDNVTTFQNTWESLEERVVNIDRVLMPHQQGLYYPSLIAEYSSIWKTLFTPSPNVQTAIEKVQRELGITSKKYNAVHVRARYDTDTVHKHAERNAINCLLEHRNNETSVLTTAHLPVYVASDAVDTVRQAVQYGRDIGVRVAGCENTTEQLHLDRGNSMLNVSNDWEGRPPSDFYPTFVDLYLLADSQCIARGIGGYGRWASLIGSSICNVNYHKRRCSAP